MASSPRNQLNAKMSGEQLNATLIAIGFNQSSFARGLGTNARTVRSWVLGEYPVPTHIAALVRLMLQAKVTPDQLPEVER
ncbi:hypothetical protein [Bradyrhizobium sp. SEMIA]|uniref:hypothetical protein n=1 Tax=Bradyrhizobium sp. SEMIA TaxID=2597515 RepID=UPI0018A3BE5B|nr:hypothetical protein [Bradyrhizobium sp. SEMIA]QOG21364.1 hypothetical protein FOM02_32680 [Bradyrhizobium sp. SEMIA]